MASEIAGVLLVPDDPALLADGPCGARPPVVIQHPQEGTWHDYGRGARDRQALVLAWNGEVSRIGCFIASDGSWSGVEDWCRTVRTLLSGKVGASDCEQGTVVLVDADGREVSVSPGSSAAAPSSSRSSS